MSGLRDRWNTRSPAERRALAAIGFASAAALIAAFVWLPLERSRSRSAAEVPALQASVARMQAQAEEVRRLRSSPARAAGDAPALASLAASPESAKLLSGATVQAPDERHVVVAGNDLAFGALLEWVAAAQASHGVRVESARIEALPAPGRVRAELRLAKP